MSPSSQTLARLPTSARTPWTAKGVAVAACAALLALAVGLSGGYGVSWMLVHGAVAGWAIMSALPLAVAIGLWLGDVGGEWSSESLLALLSAGAAR